MTVVYDLRWGVAFVAPWRMVLFAEPILLLGRKSRVNLCVKYP